MKLNEYQKAAKSTAIYPKERAIEYLSCGLASEAGEVTGKVAKFYRKDGDFPTRDVVEELGDVLWFVSQFAYELGYTLEEVAKINKDKLQSRKKRGTLKGNGDTR